MIRIPFLPESWAEVKSYGVMITIGFLVGIWFACRRAVRARANPDVILNMGIIALLGGIFGARAMFVYHYWDERFANQPSPVWAIFDIRAGGLEFWGGPLVVIPALILYLRWAGHSVRWYLDISGPSLMFGLAMARIGCFLNGCCWGSICVDEHDPARQAKGVPWAVQYPYGSPAMVQQFRFGQLAVPKELLTFLQTGQAIPLPREQLTASREELDGPSRDLRAAEEELAGAERAGLGAEVVARLRARAEAARGRANEAQRRFGLLYTNAQQYGLLPSELRDLSRHFWSRPSHPAQLYACVTGLLLYWLLDTLFYYRKRHGVVIGWMLILYSAARLLEEAIRQDNPLDYGGLTISQFISVLTGAAGVAWLLFMRALPLKSPRAVRFDPPEEPAEREGDLARA